MSPDAVILLAAIVATPIGLLWVEFHRRNDEKKAKQASCYHYWGKPFNPVGMTSYWMQRCDRCRLERHCDKDGAPHEPRR